MFAFSIPPHSIMVGMFVIDAQYAAFSGFSRKVHDSSK